MDSSRSVRGGAIAHRLKGALVRWPKMLRDICHAGRRGCDSSRGEGMRQIHPRGQETDERKKKGWRVLETAGRHSRAPRDFICSFIHSADIY